MNKTIIKDDYNLLIDAVNSTNEEIFLTYQKCAVLTEEVIRNGGKVLLCGNGGSASTASHITNDFVSHMINWDRNGYPAIALTDASVLTAISNDYGYDHVFERQVNALGKKGDILWAFSTSGNSKNIILAVEEAKKKGLITVVFTGKNGGKLKGMVDCWCPVNTDDLIIAEALHLFIIHSIVKVIEADLG
ncbi:MAG: SIS domain-containing protein [Erysipelotrichia bacterium]|nr:SIS domain-containing protein [Erysipelotrichia bacterium]